MRFERYGSVLDPSSLVGRKLADNHCASGRVSLGAPCSEQRARCVECAHLSSALLIGAWVREGEVPEALRRLLFPRCSCGSRGSWEGKQDVTPLARLSCVSRSEGFGGHGGPSRQSVPRFLVGCGDGWGASVGCAVLGCFGGLAGVLECWVGGGMDRWTDGRMDRPAHANAAAKVSQAGRYV